MSVSMQTCDIFSQAAYGVEPVLTEGIFYLYRSTLLAPRVPMAA